MTRNEEYLNTIIRALGGDPSKIPPYTFESEDNLAYLAKAFEGVTPGGGGALITNVRAKESSPTEYELDKTAGELWTAVQRGTIIYVSAPNGYTLMTSCLHDVDAGTYYFGVGDSTFTAESADEYPPVF